ncbi:hypothetical protein [Actinomycetospora soli]|uniref:hypothetical protein n=1 Tax=Actinomycetospora soli TaxID=2893887 RepID=UPI001E4780B8|nr:hypothetical protein [Actinomycetospora soli]MCD2191373.1 hypothetical protein [Actinomycetospora soli]
MSPSAIALVVFALAGFAGLVALASDSETAGGCLLIVAMLAVIAALLMSNL